MSFACRLVPRRATLAVAVLGVVVGALMALWKDDIVSAAAGTAAGAAGAAARAGAGAGNASETAASAVVGGGAFADSLAGLQNNTTSAAAAAAAAAASVSLGTFLIFMASLSATIRWLLTQVATQHHDAGVAETILLISPTSAVSLIPLAVVLEVANARWGDIMKFSGAKSSCTEI